jgi:competence protein ComEC
LTAVVPDGPARWVIGCAVATWLGVSAATEPVRLGLLIGAGGFVLTVVTRTKPMLSATMATFCLLGVLSGTAAAHRAHNLEVVDLPSGIVTLEVRVAEDASDASYGIAIGEILSIEGRRWDGPRIGLSEMPTEHTVGWLMEVEAEIVPGIRRVGDETVAGIAHIGGVHRASATSNPIVVAGNAMRERVADRYDGEHPADGLLSGFLIGDTASMSASDVESLRLAGLSHFVAVSGSNVALFLGVWWLVTAPISMHRRFRVVVGVVGLLLFAVVTRWEPSVVRACVMAGTVLVAGSVGVPLDPWMALGIAVTVLLLVSGQLVSSVGFQLSVVATAGVLLGIGLARGRTPRWLYIPLFSTVGAQLAVAPLLLATFGSVPLLAPITNLVAAPVIAAATAVAGLGVLVPPAATVARMAATFVQSLADAASGGPQLGILSSVALTALGAGMYVRSLRAPAVAVGLVVSLVVFASSPSWPTVPELTILDVGQGDAVLIRTPDRGTLLMDGGANPTVLDRALRRHGVRGIDTVVVSHPDIDHVGGLRDLVADGRVGRLVVSEFVEPFDLMDTAAAVGVPVIPVSAGDRLDMTSVHIEVLSPGRRFQSDNDGSVVLLVTADVSVLLPGDVEAVAQRELPEIDVDILVVPHHGSATTDRSWLAGVVGGTAVLSYGSNRYGHPHPDIVAILEESGAEILHTVNGDVPVYLRRVRTDVTRDR